MENSDDQFSLKWNNFQSNLATGFHDLLQEEDMVDVTLAAEGKFLQAHKIILSVCSPYFKDLFKMNPCKHPIVILKDVGHQELADMLDFMYRGEASVRQEDLAAFLKLAETLKVKGLAGDKGLDDSPVSTHQSQRKSQPVPKKKKIVEATVFEVEDDPGDPDFNPIGNEPKRKRKRVSSPQPKTDNTSTSATNSSFVPLTNPKQEVQDQEEVEFLDDTGNDPLVQFIAEKQTKHDDTNEFEDSNQDMTGDETHDGELDMTAGPSNADETAEQLPQVESDPSRYYYMENQHGLPQLVYNGYVFRRDRERARFSMNRLGESVTRVRSYWRCVLRSCKARGNVDPHGVLRLTNEHDHAPNEEKVKYRNLRAEIKKRALEYNHPPKTILEHFNIKDESLEKTIANWRYRFGKEGKQSASSNNSEYYYASGNKIKLPLESKDSDWKFYLGKSNNEEHVYATQEGDSKEEGIVLEESEEVVFEEEGIVVNDDEQLYQIEDGSQEHFEKVYYIINKN